MASKTTALAIFLTLNILFFTHTNACSYCRPGPRPRPTPRPSTPGTFPPGTFPPGTFPPGTNPPGTFPPGTNPPGTFPPGTTPPGTCPRDALKLGVCVDLLGGLLNVTIGTPPTLPCCTLIQGLADLEAAICLCTVIRASILGINLNIPVSLSLLLNVCGRNVPRGFQCA